MWRPVPDLEGVVVMELCLSTRLKLSVSGLSPQSLRLSSSWSVPALQSPMTVSDGLKYSFLSAQCDTILYNL